MIFFEFLQVKQGHLIQNVCTTLYLYKTTGEDVDVLLCT